MDRSEDIQSWVTREGLPPGTVQVLEDQGFTSLDDIKLLTPNDIKECLLGTGLLNLAQCLRLQKAVAGLTQLSLSVTDYPTQSSSSTPDHGSPGGSSGEAGNTFRLLLSGKTGSGKSTTGNTILGQKLFETSPNFCSVTAACERHTGARGDTRIEIMDTPGLYDTSKSQKEIGATIIRAVAGMHPGPHAVLLVARVGRFTEEEYNVYQRLKALFDEDVSKYMILLFTHGDSLEREGCTLEDLIASPELPDSLKTILNECGHRCLLINNVADDPGPQVDKLLEIVRQTVVRNGGSPYSCPKYSKIGEELEEEVNKRMEKFDKENIKRQRYVQELEKETRKAKEDAEKARQQFEKLEHERELEMKEKQQQTREATEQERKLYGQDHRTEQEQKQLDELVQECKRLELEQIKMQQEHEAQKLKQKEELEIKEREYAKKMEKQKEEERKKDEEREKKMERLKQDVVELKEPGFIGKAVNWVTSWFSKK